MNSSRSSYDPWILLLFLLSYLPLMFVLIKQGIKAWHSSNEVGKRNHWGKPKISPKNCSNQTFRIQRKVNWRTEWLIVNPHFPTVLRCESPICSSAVSCRLDCGCCQRDSRIRYGYEGARKEGGKKKGDNFMWLMNQTNARQRRTGRKVDRRMDIHCGQIVAIWRTGWAFTSHSSLHFGHKSTCLLSFVCLVLDD